ncbi:hypothetical protein DsansV1_C14g0129391 [Dioscorea sansibarensis]
MMVIMEEYMSIGARHGFRFLNFLYITQILKNYKLAIAWKINEAVQNLKSHLKKFPNLKVETINRKDNNMADALVEKGRINPQPTLYYQGRDRPR